MKQDFRFHTIRTVLAVVLALFSAAVAGAQGRFTVTGKVSDASGKPMVGVTIIEQGTTNGTTTGLDGTYSLVWSRTTGACSSSVRWATRRSR